jgi:hypothetical protein
MILLFAVPAHAWTANFDTLSEGTTSTSLVEDGITFGELDNLLDPPPCTMVIDQQDGTLSGFPQFSAPNALGFGGYSPGNGAAFGRFGSLAITPPAEASDAVIQVFDLGNSGTTLRLEASLLGSVVATADVPLNGFAGPYQHTLEVHGVAFDRLQLLGGGNGQTAVFISIDSIELTPAPLDTGEPPDTDLPVDTDPPDDTDRVEDTDLPADTDLPVDTGHASDTDGPPDTDGADTDGLTHTPLAKTCGCDGSGGGAWAVGAAIAALGMRRRHNFR